MNLLLDTHTLLWWMSGGEMLTKEATDAIASPENTVFLSAVVIWEIRIKEGIGKLELPEEFDQALSDQWLTELPVMINHANALAQLPPIHRDPFDRMLVAQASVEDLVVVTRDAIIADYGVKVIAA